MTEIKLEIREEQRELYERLLDIVHCTDCKYMKPKKDPLGCLIATCEYTRWITIHGEGFENCSAVTADDYCSRGERKDD